MKDDWDTRAGEGITASEERRVAIVERGLRNGLAYSAAGLGVGFINLFFDHPADKYILGGATALMLRGGWLLVRTASRAQRRKRTYKK